MEYADTPLHPKEADLMPGQQWIAKYGGSLPLYSTCGLLAGSRPATLISLASLNCPLEQEEHEALSVLTKASITLATKYLSALKSPEFVERLKGDGALTLNRLFRADGNAYGAPSASTAKRQQAAVLQLLTFLLQASRKLGEPNATLDRSSELLHLGQQIGEGTDVTPTALRLLTRHVVNWLTSTTAADDYLRSLVVLRSRETTATSTIRLATPTRIAEQTTSLLSAIRLLIAALKACTPRSQPTLPAYLRDKPSLTADLSGARTICTWLKYAKEICQGDKQRALDWVPVGRDKGGRPTAYLVEGLTVYVTDLAQFHNRAVSDFWEYVFKFAELLQEPATETCHLSLLLHRLRDRQGQITVVQLAKHIDLDVHGIGKASDIVTDWLGRGGDTDVNLCLLEAGERLQQLAKLLCYLGGANGARTTEIDGIGYPDGVNSIPIIGGHDDMCTAPAGVLGRITLSLATEKYGCKNAFRDQLMSEDATTVILAMTAIVRPVLLKILQGTGAALMMRTLFVPGDAFPASIVGARRPSSEVFRDLARLYLDRDIKVSYWRTFTDAYMSTWTSPMTAAEECIWSAQSRSKGHSVATLCNVYLQSSNPSASRGETDVEYCLRYQHAFGLMHSSAVELTQRAEAQSIGRAEGGEDSRRVGQSTSLNRPGESTLSFEEARSWLDTCEGRKLVRKCVGLGEEGAPLTFRPGQHEALAGVLSETPTLLVADVGTGKTAVFWAPSLRNRIIAVSSKTTLVLVPLRALVVQHARQAAEVGLHVYILGSEYPETAVKSFQDPDELPRNSTPEVIIMSVDVFVGRSCQRWWKRELSARHINMLVVDEAQEVILSTWRPVFAQLTMCISQADLSEIAVLATSATVTRAAEPALFKALCFPEDALVVRSHWPQLQVRYEALRMTTLQHATAVLEEKCHQWLCSRPGSNGQTVIDSIAEAFNSGSVASMPPNSQILIFGGTKQVCNGVADLLNSVMMGLATKHLKALSLPDTANITEESVGRIFKTGRLAGPCFSGLDVTERGLQLTPTAMESALLNRQILVVVATSRVALGFHHPCIRDCIIMHADSHADAIQMLGRCGRTGLPANATILQTPVLGRASILQESDSADDASARGRQRLGGFYQPHSVNDLTNLSTCLRQAISKPLHDTALTCKQLELQRQPAIIIR